MIKISVFLHLLFCLVRETTDTAKPMKIVANSWTSYESLNWAAHKIYLSKNQFPLVEAFSTTEVIRSFRDGLREGGALTLGEVILLAQQGFYPKFVLLADYSKGTKDIVEKKGIKTIADLSGKILKMGGTSPFDSSQVPIEILDVVVFSAQTLKRYSGSMNSLPTAWAKSTCEIINLTQREHLQFMAQREKTSIDLIAESLKPITLGNPDENATHLTSNPVRKDSLHKLNVYRNEASLLNHPVTELGLFLELVTIATNAE